MSTLATIDLSDITLSGHDARGRFAVATIDGETVGVSRDGEDDCLRSLDGLEPGDVVEVGTDRMRVTATK